jgi:hypothetical protein
MPLCGAGAAPMTTSSCTGPPMFSTTGSALRGAAARIGAGAAARCGAGAALLASKESIHRPASGGGGFAAAAATGSAAGGGDAATRGSGDAVGSAVGGGGMSGARAGGGNRATGGGGDAGVTAHVPLGCFTFSANPQMLAVCAATTERLFCIASKIDHGLAAARACSRTAGSAVSAKPPGVATRLLIAVSTVSSHKHLRWALR